MLENDDIKNFEDDELLYNSFIEEIKDLEKINIEEFEKNITLISDENISKRNSLKPNLRNSIFLAENKKDNTFFVFFKLSNKISSLFSLNDEAKNILKSNSKNNEIETKKLKLIATLIVKYYRQMIKAYQEEIATLPIEILFSEYSEHYFNLVENIIQKLLIFFTRVYYRYPLYEDNDVNKYLEYLMSKYNILDQIIELEKTLHLIREISISQIKRREEKKKEKDDKKNEKWNVIFAILGILIAVIEVYVGIIK